MSLPTPRYYQAEALAAIHAARAEGVQRILYTQATGTGKTNTYSWLIGDLLKAGFQRGMVVAHREELLDQGASRLLHLYPNWLTCRDVGIEQGPRRADKECKVIFASRDTLRSGKRLIGWQPEFIIVDECHHAAAESYLNIFKQFGVLDGVLLIGCTATSRRGDKQSIYAYDIAGKPTLDEEKERAKCVFERLVYDYSILQAIQDAYLVPITPWQVKTGVDLRHVKTTAGDFNKGELQKAIVVSADDSEEVRKKKVARTAAAIKRWREVADGRPTIAFCQGVEHAHHSAELWRNAGVTAEALDGETETGERRAMLHRFKSGKTTVLCNDAVLTEGFDAPNCACIVLLKPTKSWPQYVQMAGRGLRPLPGLIDHLDDPSLGRDLHRRVEDAKDRAAAIAFSEKPDCILIDIVDIIDKMKLCTAPSILELPPALDLQGHDLLETKKLLDTFKENSAQIIGECPETYEELQTILERVDVLTENGADAKWKVADYGYYFTKLPPNRQAKLLHKRLYGVDRYKLVLLEYLQEIKVREDGKPIFWPAGTPIERIFEQAEDCIRWVWPPVAPSAPVSAGPDISPKQRNVLRRNGYLPSQIQEMTTAEACRLVGQFMEEYRQRRAGLQREEDE